MIAVCDLGLKINNREFPRLHHGLMNIKMHLVLL